MEYILKEACNEFNLNYNKAEIPPAPLYQRRVRGDFIDIDSVAEVIDDCEKI